MADTAHTIDIVAAHIYLLVSRSTSANYASAYILVGADSVTAYVIPLKTATGVTVTPIAGGDITVTTTTFAIPFKLVDLSMFG